MESPDLRGHRWAGILLSASLLTVWSLTAAAQISRDAVIQSEEDIVPSTFGAPWLPQTHGRSLAKPTISVSQGTVIEHRENVTFYCDTPDVNITIHWVFNHQPLPSHERIQLSTDGKTLTILSVQRKDAGTYQCEAWGDLQMKSSDPTYLIVYYGPDSVTIKVEPGVPNGDTVEVMEGSSVTFSAETESYPQASYSWFFSNDSKPITWSLFFNMSNVTIPAVSKEHEGTYACLVSNAAAQKSLRDAVKVRVLERVTKPYVMAPNQTLVEDTSSVVLTCQTTHEGVGVRWFLGDQLLQSSEHLAPNNRDLIIHGLRRNDTGPYACEVWNWGSQARSEPLKLNISCHRSSSLGAIVGITVGILAIVALAIGLGCFIHTGNAEGLSRRTTEHTAYENMTPTSEEGHPEELGRSWPMPVYANAPAIEGQIPVKKMLPVDPPEQLYEQLSPPTSHSRYSHGPRKPSSNPLVPTPQKENAESNYEALVNPEHSIYCQINRST
uniref:Ig-like domain-containing protein n=1 Tax=Bos indicus x Bos taurus TaxID=30522 RepID=A0A4W2CJV8_BOBOX